MPYKMGVIKQKIPKRGIDKRHWNKYTRTKEVRRTTKNRAYT